MGDTSMEKFSFHLCAAGFGVLADFRQLDRAPAKSEQKKKIINKFRIVLWVVTS